MLAVPETAGVHLKTRSGELPELPQLPACRPVPLVVPLKVPPCAEMTVGLVQLPGRVVVAVLGGREVEAGDAPVGVTVRLRVDAARAHPSTTMKHASTAVSARVMGQAYVRPCRVDTTSAHP